MNERNSGPAWERISPQLLTLCTELVAHRINPYVAHPHRIAAHFCAFFNTLYPINMCRANQLIGLIGIPVFFYPALKAKTKENQARGHWDAWDRYAVILVDPSKKKPNGRRVRPEASLIYTLLHEIGEIILSICNSLLPRPWAFTNRQREGWANSFAAGCMMPPTQFIVFAERYGLDLRALAEEFQTTLASTARHVRDVVVPTKGYYFARCDIVYQPEDHCAPLVPLLEASGGGFCVRMWDVVRTKSVNVRRNRAGGALPMYNLPRSIEYRVIHPAFQTCVEKGVPIFIHSVYGAATLEHGTRYRDLFNLQDMSVLAIPYGLTRVRGLFLQAMPTCDNHLLVERAEELKAVSVGGVDGIFSWQNYLKPKGQKSDAQPQLPYRLKKPIRNKLGRIETEVPLSRKVKPQAWPWLPDAHNSAIYSDLPQTLVGYLL